jgi:tripartite-type tricarboxylate transporter receptor subunit TctC
MRRAHLFGLWIVIALSFTVAAWARTSPQYPTRPVSLIVAFPAGGSSDIGARIVAGIAERGLGQPIVVVNRAGAGGQVGFTELARARPDGYTIGLINLPALNTIILDPERRAGFDLDAFTPIINHVVDPGMILVLPDSPYRSLKDLVEDARRRPGEVTVGTTGILSDDHLAVLMLERAAGVRFRTVHFAGGAPLLAAVLGRTIDAGFENVGGWAPRIRAGELKALAVLDARRSKFLLGVPTAGEQGFAVISSSSRGIAAPRGVPDTAIKRLQSIFRRAMETTEHRRKMDAAGLTVRIMVGDDYLRYLRDVHETAGRHVREIRR